MLQLPELEMNGLIFDPLPCQRFTGSLSVSFVGYENIVNPLDPMENIFKKKICESQCTTVWLQHATIHPNVSKCDHPTPLLQNFHEAKEAAMAAVKAHRLPGTRLYTSTLYEFDMAHSRSSINPKRALGGGNTVATQDFWSKARSKSSSHSKSSMVQWQGWEITGNLPVAPETKVWIMSNHRHDILLQAERDHQIKNRKREEYHQKHSKTITKTIDQSLFLRLKHWCSCFRLTYATCWPSRQPQAVPFGQWCCCPSEGAHVS